MLPTEVFLSHASQDQEVAGRLAEVVRRHGIPVFYSPHNIVPVMLTDCSFESLSWTLSAFQRIDFTDNFDDGCRALLRIWGVGLKT
jgi:hypothetical protein